MKKIRNLGEALHYALDQMEPEILQAEIVALRASRLASFVDARKKRAAAAKKQSKKKTPVHLDLRLLAKECGVELSEDDLKKLSSLSKRKPRKVKNGS